MITRGFLISCLDTLTPVIIWWPPPSPHCVIPGNVFRAWQHWPIKRGGLLWVGPQSWSQGRLNMKSCSQQSHHASLSLVVCWAGVRPSFVTHPASWKRGKKILVYIIPKFLGSPEIHEVSVGFLGWSLGNFLANPWELGRILSFTVLGSSLGRVRLFFVFFWFFGIVLKLENNMSALYCWCPSPQPPIPTPTLYI